MLFPEYFDGSSEGVFKDVHFDNYYVFFWLVCFAGQILVDLV